MRGELKEKLLATAPMLYKYFKDNPKSVPLFRRITLIWQIGVKSI